MEIKQNEWLAAKGLILSLAESLSLDGGELFGAAETSKLADHILKNPSSFSSVRSLLSHVIRLIPTLKNVQRQIDHWMQMLPPDSTEGGQTPDSMDKAGSEALVRMKEESDRSSGANRLSEIKIEAPKTALRAQEIIGDVRSAIQMFSSATPQSEPRPESFRFALSKLKPLVDDLIEALSANSLDPHQEGGFSPFKSSPALGVKEKDPAHVQEKVGALLEKIAHPEKDKPRFLSKTRTYGEEERDLKRLPERFEPSNKGGGAVRDSRAPHREESHQLSRNRETSDVSISTHLAANSLKNAKQEDFLSEPDDRSHDPMSFSSAKKEIGPSLVKSNPIPVIGLSLPILTPPTPVKKKKRKRYFFLNERENESEESKN